MQRNECLCPTSANRSVLVIETLLKCYERLTSILTGGVPLTTDTSERGLERLICTAHDGSS